MDIENSKNNSSNNQSKPGYSNVLSDSKGDNTSGISGKLKTLKTLIKFPSFSSKNTESSDVSSQNNNTTITSTQEAVKEKTCKDKIEEKIVEKIEVEKNIAVFLMLIALGCGLLCLSIFLLPLIITSPSKFSLCFAMGSLLVLISFLFYYGTKEYFRTLFGAQRFWISILFILSIIIGISFSLGKHYIISMLCSICQLVSLIVFILSFVPGGRVGINCIKKAITSPFSGLWMRMAASQIANS